MGELAAPHRVLVVGDINPDLILRGDVVPRFGQAEQLLDAADLLLGGSAGIAAAGLARLGVPTSIVAAVGDDPFGRQALAWLRDVGVDTSHVAVLGGVATGLSVHLSTPGDRAILTLPGAIPRLRAGEVRQAVAALAPAWVHIASPFLTPAATAGLPELLAALRREAIGSSLDTNWDPADSWQGIGAALADLAVLMPNRAELRALADAVAPSASAPRYPRDEAAALAATGPRVVVKDGAEGGWSLDATGAAARAPGIPIEVVDTTGAGDSFDAGYLAAIAHGVAEETQRLRWATAAGSLSTRAAGGVGGQATLPELVATLAA